LQAKEYILTFFCRRIFKVCFEVLQDLGKKYIVGARLAGEGARKVHALFEDAFAGKPAPTD
jgi:hypothetical protein